MPISSALAASRASARFAVCMAATLTEETGYVQPAGGPYRRNARGTLDVPRHPDGCWYDDDPHDTGGRTGAGILQREYDPWRQARGLLTRDVWIIGDDELDALYREQYWNAVRGDDLPPGLDLAVYDMSVLNGVGTACRALQMALGVAVDGHIGAATLAALAAHEVGDAIHALCDIRRRRCRQAPTFYRFGKGWLARIDRIEMKARQMAFAVPAEHIAPEADSAVPVPSRKARVAPPTTMLESDTGKASTLMGGVSGAGIATEMSTAAAATASQGRFTVAAFLMALASSPTFWICVITLAGSAYVWLERRAKLPWGH